MNHAKNRKTIHQYFRGLPWDIRDHFEYFNRLLNNDYPFEVLLAYLHYRIELAHRDILYCGVVRRYRIDGQLARRAVRRERLTRDGYKARFHAIFGVQIPETIATILNDAESIRDNAVHGSEPSDSEMREGIINGLAYARKLNGFVQRIDKFRPFGNLKGVLGGSDVRLDPATSRLVLKGLGFSLS